MQSCDTVDSELIGNAAKYSNLTLADINLCRDMANGAEVHFCIRGNIRVRSYYVRWDTCERVTQSVQRLIAAGIVEPFDFNLHGHQVRLAAGMHDLVKGDILQASVA